MKKIHVTYSRQLVGRPDYPELAFLERMSDLKDRLGQIGGVTLVSWINDSDITIAIMDRPSEELSIQVVQCSNLDGELWCFVPRNTVVDVRISTAIANHRTSHPSCVQHVYPYDSDDDIIRMVRVLVGSKHYTAIASHTLIDNRTQG